VSRAESGDDVGFEYVPRSICADWRAAIHDGTSVGAIASGAEWGYKTVRRHLYGREQCSHGGPSHPDPATAQPDGAAVGTESTDVLFDAMLELLESNYGDCATTTPGKLRDGTEITIATNRISAGLSALADADTSDRGAVIDVANPDANRSRYRIREVSSDGE
jgi:hypothetical protein